MGHSLLVIIITNEIKVDLTKFHHASALPPVIAILVNTVKRNQSTTWPGLDQILMTKNLELSVSTAKGNLD